MNDNLKNLLISIANLDVNAEDYFDKLRSICENEEIDTFSISKNNTISISFFNIKTRGLHCSPAALQSLCKTVLSVNGVKYRFY